MEYGRAACPERGAVAIAQSRRRYYRQKVQNLAYINLDHSNGGILRNVGEGGVAVQAVAPLTVDQPVHVRFELLNPRARVEAAGRVAWADPMGQAGVEFVGLSRRGQRLLKDWMFTQLLAAAYQVFGTDSIFVHGKRSEAAAELRFSLAPDDSRDTERGFSGTAAAAEKVELPWCPLALSRRTISRMVDSLVLVAAILLFSVISATMTHVFPSWPIGLALLLAVASAFATVYWFLFMGWIGLTPGMLLARFAAGDEEIGKEPEDRARFR
jgi:Tfp pilus assembly protein PilZ